MKPKLHWVCYPVNMGGHPMYRLICTVKWPRPQFGVPSQRKDWHYQLLLDKECMESEHALFYLHHQIADVTYAIKARFGYEFQSIVQCEDQHQRVGDLPNLRLG